jgi:hypothetical protein
MKVTITKIFIENKRGCEVEFKTELGNCKGVWMGVKPLIGETYEIEIEIPYMLKWGRDILLAQNQMVQIKINEHNISLIGILETTNDNFLALKLGNDIVLLEAEGTPFEEKNFIEVLTNDLVLYDTNL